jgi:hypothetical protein
LGLGDRAAYVFGERVLFGRRDGIAWPTEAGVRELVEREAGEVRVCRACGCEATPGVRLAEFMTTMMVKGSGGCERRQDPFMSSFVRRRRQWQWARLAVLSCCDDYRGRMCEGENEAGARVDERGHLT